MGWATVFSVFLVHCTQIILDSLMHITHVSLYIYIYKPSQQQSSAQQFLLVDGHFERPTRAAVIFMPYYTPYRQKKLRHGRWPDGTTALYYKRISSSWCPLIQTN
jgi:hypothetical protein